MGTENVGLAPRYQDKPSSCWEQFLEPGEPQPAGSQHGEAPEGWRCCSAIRAVVSEQFHQQDLKAERGPKETSTALGHESGSTATCNMLLSITTLATQAQNKAVG